MSTSLAFIGIDPGASGGYACVYPDGTHEAFAFDSEADAIDWLGAKADQVRLGVMRYSVAIELVGGFIGRPQAGSHMFKFGKSAGFWHGAVMMTRVLPFYYVRPQTWQAGLPGVAGAEGPDRKRILRDVARQRYPTGKFTLANCDALLIADWLLHQS